MMPPSHPLSQEQLKRLDEHKYNSAGSSLLEPVMQHFWEWLLQRLPPWVAPNLITVLGLAVNVLTTLLLVWHCPTATERAPLWVYLTCAAGLFLYQSLDAIDGKQARRTASSTALGELFDHGCDALSTVFVVLGTCVSAQLGTHPDAMFFCCFAAMAMFYLAHWQTYVLGTLRCGAVDVTEVQMFIIGVHLAAAFGGPTLWQSVLPLPSPVAGLLLPAGQDALPAKMAPLLFTVAGALFSASGYLRVIFAGGVGKNRSTIAGSSVLGPLFHIGMVLALATAIHKKSPARLFERHPCLYVLAFGFVSAKVTSKLMVAHITKSEMQLADWAFLGPGLLVLNQYFNSVLDEHILLWVALLLSALDLLRYSVSICNQIAAHLDISVFKLKPNAIGGLASPAGAAFAPSSNSSSEYATSSSSSKFGNRNQRGDPIPATRFRSRSGRP